MEHVVISGVEHDAHDGRPGVLRGVGEGLRHDVVRGHLDPLRQPSLSSQLELDGNG